MCPETTSPWLNPISSDHVTGLTAVRSIASTSSDPPRRAEGPDPEGRPCLEVTFQDALHAEWALWQLGADAEAVTPPSVRNALHHRAAAMAERYAV